MSDKESQNITAVMCECGRLYKDRRDKDGKTMCSACYCDCSVETLQILWSMPKMEGKDE